MYVEGLGPFPGRHSSNESGEDYQAHLKPAVICLTYKINTFHYHIKLIYYTLYNYAIYNDGLYMPYA